MKFAKSPFIDQFTPLSLSAKIWQILAVSSRNCFSFRCFWSRENNWLQIKKNWTKGQNGTRESGKVWTECVPFPNLAINRTNAHSVDRNAVMGLRKTSLLR